jgi:hypothetical protein
MTQILYDTSLLNKFTLVENKTWPDRKTKWAKFTYTGKETKFISKLFNNVNLKIAFTTQNNVGKHVSKEKNRYNQNKFEKCCLC